MGVLRTPKYKRYEVRRELRSSMPSAFMVRSRGTPPNHLAGQHCSRTKFLARFPLIRLFCSFSSIEGQRFCGASIVSRAATESICGHDKGVGWRSRRFKYAATAIGTHRGRGGVLVSNCARLLFETQFSPRLVVGIAPLVHDCGSRAPQAAGIQVAVFFLCVVGLLGCRRDVAQSPHSPKESGRMCYHLE
jgi:hypothetical protein